jgi:hypothetical protein
MSHRLRLLGAFAASAALLLGACSSSGSDADKKKDTSTEASDTNSDVASDGTSSDMTSDDTGSDVSSDEGTDQAAQARADAVDLTVSDFPDGWDNAPAEPDDPSNPLKKCDPSFQDENDTSLAEHDTDQFTIGSLDSGNGAQFEAQTKVYASADEATASLDPFTDDDVISCIDSTVKELFGDGQGATVTGKLDHDSTDVGADQAEELIGDYTIQADDGSSAKVTLGILAIRTDDVATLVTALAMGDAIESTSLEGPVKKIVELQKG